MRLSFLLPAALMALLVTSARADVANVAPDSGRPAITLKLAKGHVSAYRIVVNQTGTMTLPGAGQGMPMQSDITADAKLFVDKVNSDGSYAVRYRMGGIKGNVNFAGQAMPIPNLPKSMEIAGTLAQDGKFTPAKKPAPGSFSNLDPGQTLSGLVSTLFTIPPRAVVAGDTWDTTIPLSMDPAGATTVTVKNVVSAIESQNGKNVARVEQTYNGPLTINLTDPVPVSLKGTYSGSGTTRIVMDSGRTISNTSVVRTVANIETASPSGNGETTTMAIDSTSTTKITSFDLPATPAKPAAKPAAKKKASGTR